VSLLTKFLDKIRTPAPKVVMTAWGPIDERIRLSVVHQLRTDPEAYRLVRQKFITDYGEQAGLAEAKARYPEIQWNAPPKETHHADRNE
jgi:hypothetical protein